jgi:sugar/nucleoside kinase (ribokinase family)
MPISFAPDSHFPLGQSAGTVFTGSDSAEPESRDIQVDSTQIARQFDADIAVDIDPSDNAESRAADRLLDLIRDLVRETDVSKINDELVRFAGCHESSSTKEAIRHAPAICLILS